MDYRQLTTKRAMGRLAPIIGALFILFIHFPLPSVAHTDQLIEDYKHLKSASELDYPPFAIVNSDGTVGGFSVELLQAAVEAAGLKVSFKVGPWQELKEELSFGKLDVLPLVSYSIERDKMYDFTAPYLTMNGTVFVLKGNTDIGDLDDLMGKEVLVMQGDTAHEYLVHEKLTDKIFPTTSYEEAFQLLAGGQHDAVVVQHHVGLQIIKKLRINNVVAVQNKYVTTLKPVALKLEGFEQHFCFAVQEGNHKLLSQLNEGLRVLYLDGTYENLYNKWFAPILPPPQYSFSQIIKEALYVVVPLILGLAFLAMWYLKRQVAKRTLFLVQEIQQRHRIEKALEDANDNYIKAQKIGKVGNWTYDISTEEFFGSVEAKRIYGFDKNSSSFSTETVEACIPERVRVHKALIDLIENYTPYDLEFEIITSGRGERRTVISRAEVERDASGNPLKVSGVIQDITERKQTEEALRNSERLLNEVGGIARIGGWEHDLITREATWTRETFKIVEIESELVPGPDEHLNYYPPEDRAILDKGYRQAMETGKPFDLELRYRTVAGRSIWVRIIGHPEFKDEKCIKMRGTFQDITEQKKMQENLLQSERLEALGVLAGGIAHDFNNILSAILGFTELARDNNPTNSQLQEDLNEIYIGGVRAKELVQQMMAFSRKVEHAPVPLSVSAIAKKTLKQLLPSFPPSLKIKLDINENVRQVIADPIQLRQIIMNLCTNAGQAMEDTGGILTIKVSETVPSDTLLSNHPYLVPGRYVKLCVQDTGTGIEPEILGSIFDPYFSTKNHGDGTGLGLAVTYGIVREMSGDIVVKSELGKGSIFMVFLPVAEQALINPQDTI